MVVELRDFTTFGKDFFMPEQNIIDSGQRSRSAKTLPCKVSQLLGHEPIWTFAFTGGGEIWGGK